MCGIAIASDYKTTQTLLDAIKSRGPDETRLHYSDGYYFGFHRLAIVATEGDKGRQPYEDDEVIVMLNGELYNWDRSFGSEILWLAHLVKSCSDFPRMLVGQYFIVVYFKREKLFILARDHVGIIPGYFSLSNGKVIVCSEKVPGHDWQEVLPAFMIVVDSMGHLDIRAMWMPSLGRASLRTQEHSVQLRQAVHVIANHADAGFSLALGGLDSMILLKMLVDGGWTADEVITVGFGDEGPEGDLAYAQKFCDLMAVPLKKVVLQSEYDEVLLAQLSKRLGEDLSKNPIKRWGAYRAAMVAIKATNKVILSGDGADELFYGYPYFDVDEEPALSFGGLQSLLKMHHINLDRTDRAGMLFSKEFRPVYLYRDYVEWVLKHKRGKRKEDLRALARFLGIPAEFINRPKWTATDRMANDGNT